MLEARRRKTTQHVARKAKIREMSQKKNTYLCFFCFSLGFIPIIIISRDPVVLLNKFSYVRLAFQKVAVHKNKNYISQSRITNWFPLCFSSPYVLAAVRSPAGVGGPVRGRRGAELFSDRLHPPSQ